MAKTTEDLKALMDQLVDTVDEAVSTGDFSHMSRDLGRLARDAKTAGSDAVHSAAQSYRRYQKSTSKTWVDGSYREVEPSKTQNEYIDYRTPQGERNRAVPDRLAEERRLQPYFMPPASTMGPRILSIFGISAGSLWGCATLGMLIALMFVHGSIAAVVGNLMAVFGVLTAGSFLMAHLAGRSARRLRRFNQYRKLLGTHLYADVKSLSSELHRPEQEIIRELEELTQKGMIRQGHFDEGKTCFIASDELYEQYRKTAIRMKEEEALPAEVQALLKEGNDCIAAIRKANERIPGEEVSDKLNRMERIVSRIFDEVKRRPELSDKLGMFMEYYLPTTRKLVNAYADMDQTALKGENVTAAKREIEESLDTINEAFETLLDSFFKEQALDVSSDISVMKTMLKQDGLTEDRPFEKKEV